MFHPTLWEKSELWEVSNDHVFYKNRVLGKSNCADFADR